jgi:hypothetical protein
MRPSSALRLGAWLGLLLGAALAGACFDAPRPAVQFSCDPAEAPQCPAGYTCEADGCCHLDGSRYEDHVGACKLGGLGGTAGGDSTTSAETEASTGSEASTGGASSDESTASGGSGESDATAGTSESGDTAGTSESGSTGT